MGLDDDSDIDVLAFTVAGPVVLDAIVVPEGLTYLEGPQNTNGTCSDGTPCNTLDNVDLRREVLDTGHAVIASANDGGAGDPETLAGVDLAAAGAYWVRVSAANVADEPQLYRREPSTGSGSLIFAGGLESGDASQWSGR